jgi:Skp family chaperone for outer membrane proteins
MAELAAQNTQLQSLISRRDSQVLTESARAQVAKTSPDCSANSNFLARARKRSSTSVRPNSRRISRQVVPVVSDIAKERGLHAVFLASPQLLYADPRVDIANEVIQRMDTKSKE